MYQDQKFYTRVQHIVSPATSFGTATASGAAGHTTTGVVPLPKFIRRTKVNNIRMRCSVVPNANSTGLIARFMNGTNTFGTVVLTTAGLQAQLDGAMTEANATFAANAQPTVDIVGTSTASGVATGSYEIWFETQEQYS